MATESELRYNAAHFLDAYKGCAEGGTLHKKLVDMFNNSGLCTRYKVTYTDAWCAVAYCDCFIGTGMEKLIPIDCGCAEMITESQAMGIWQENDAYVPKIGDGILYDWQDTTGSKSDNTGTPNHIGMVQTVSGSSFTVIEGNYSNTVKVRTMQVNGSNIRGFITPDYASMASSGSTGSTTGMTEKADPEVIWDFLMGKIGNAYGVAGVMGNMYAESMFIPINLQDSYETKLGYTDKTYTEAVDNGTYTNFVNDNAGYGLVQWTFYTLKQGLLDYCQSKKASIGNLDAQLEFLCIEIPDEVPSLWKILQNATSVKEASDAMLTKFEQPADQSDSVKEKRASYGQTYYDLYSGKTAGSTDSDGIEAAAGFDDSIAGTYTVTADGLNLRKGAGKDKTYIMTVPYGTPVRNYGYYTDVNGTRWLCVVLLDGTKGWMSGAYLTKGTSSGTTTSSTPTFKVGSTYTTQVDHLAVRSGAGTSYSKKTKSQLTSDGQKHAYDDGCLKKGTSLTCQETKTVNGDIWMRVPSGWIAAYYDCEQYVK